MGEIQLIIIVRKYKSECTSYITDIRESVDEFFACRPLAMNYKRIITRSGNQKSTLFLPFFLDTHWVGFTILDPEQVKLNECGSILIRKTTVDKSETFILNNRGRYVMNNSLPK